MPQIVEAIAKSRREANRVKREQPITVVIGNPPYKEKAEGRGGWIEKGAGGKLAAPLDRWKAPRDWGVGAHGKHLKNLYVYFWRWATLKVFGSGRFAATGCPIRTKKESSASSLSPAFSTGRASRRCATICAGRARTSG